MSKRTCTAPECDRPYRARGLCGSHYNQAHAPDRHTKKLVPCAWCGTEVLKHSGGGRKYGAVCSEQCRTWLRFGYSVLPNDHWARWYGKTCEWKQPTPKVDTLPRNCAWCGNAYTSARLAQTLCSERCSTRAKRSRRRAREHAAPGTYTWAEVMRIWVDIGKVCAYCHQATAGIEPDHVIPLSKGGSNSITNIAPACQACNSDKRDLLLTEWHVDRMRRGLPARSLHPAIRHLTHALLTT